MEGGGTTTNLSGPSQSNLSGRSEAPHARRPFVAPQQLPSEMVQPPLPTRRNIRWNDHMDRILVERLHEEVISGPRRADNGFTNAVLQTVIDKVRIQCGIVVRVTNIRARLKTLRNSFLEVRELLQLSGFGIDNVTGRVTAEEEVWEAYLEGKSDPHKIRNRCCKYYEDLATIYGNDTATGVDAVSGDDFEGVSLDTQAGALAGTQDTPNLGDEDIGTSHMEDNPQHDATQANQHPSGSNTSTHSHGQSRKRSSSSMNPEVEAALTTAIESMGDAGRRIADALEGTNWEAVEKRLWEVPGMNDDDLITMMEIFEKDDKLPRLFLGLSARAKERWVIRKLERRPGSFD